MILSTVFLLGFLLGRVTSNCEYGRSSGFFKNYYMNSGDADFIDETGANTGSLYDFGFEVTFDKQINVFSAHTNTIRIRDTGLISFGIVPGSGVTETFEYTGSNGPFDTTLLQQSFASPLWFKDDTSANVEYRFRYRVLKRSDLINSDNLTTGPSMCYLQRIEDIIFDCNDAGSNNRNPTGDSKISQAVIVTWQIKDSTKEYYMQAVVAIDSKTSDSERQTYIIFVYGDPSNLPTGVTTFLTGFVNGLYSSAAQREYAAVCPYKKNAAAADISNIHLKSNCRCGSWNQGIYVFRTRDNSGATTEISNTCAKTEAELVTQCALPLINDHMQLPLACRPSRSLQDTCIEDIYCKQTATANTVSVTVNLHKPKWTSFIYLSYSDLVSNTITPSTSATCKRSLTAATGDRYYNTIELSTSSLVCGFQYTSATSTLNFALKTYDQTDNTAAEMVKPGDVILKGTCEILSLELQKDVAFKCRTTYAQNMNKAFYMEESFKESFYSTTVNMAEYNHCQSSGKLDAARWLVGGANTIYFRCNIGFCRYTSNKSNSKCVDSCANTVVDWARRKRDVNGTADVNPYPDVAVETFIRIENPREAGFVGKQVECVNSTVAIATLVAQIVLLLVCIGITSMMFCKVRSRQKKL